MSSLILLLPFIQRTPEIAFDVTCPHSAYSGQEHVSAVIYLSKRGGQPMYGPDWFHPEPCYSSKFTARAGDELVVGNSNAIGFPGRLSDLPAGEYTVQAVIDRNLGGRAIGTSPGNYYSDPVQMHLDAGATGLVKISCPHEVPEPSHTDTARLKFEKYQSKLLTAFYHRATFLKAAVGLPSNYGDGSRFPTIFEIPGFGGSIDNPREATSAVAATDKPGQSFIYVLLDPNVPTGHSVFADSDNNGPWGTALTSEFIPYLESKYHMIGTPSARFVRGHSSGGWSSLWLQVSHPDFFGGVWSTSPDPVDFTDFQMIDIYRRGENMFYDRSGHLRPLARNGSQILANYKPFSDMERPIRGEQLGSFEAVFSKRGPDGNPEKLWDRDTGAINYRVADDWKRYDISLLLRTHWQQLGPKLKGKLHVYCGNEDTFYLDGAVRKLKATLAQLGSDASVELLPGNHFTVMTRALRERIDREMVEQFSASRQ